MKTQATCKLCGVNIPTERIPVIGESVQVKAQKAAQAMINHLGQLHPQHIAEILQATTQYQTFLTLNSFMLEDPPLRDSLKIAYEFATDALNKMATTVTPADA